MNYRLKICHINLTFKYSYVSLMYVKVKCFDFSIIILFRVCNKKMEKLKNKHKKYNTVTTSF